MTKDTHTDNVRLDYPSEIEALMGILILYWRVEEEIECLAAEEIDPLTKPERRMLVGLGRPIRMGDLAKAMYALPSSVTATARQLEDKALIRRERDPNDRRAWLLCPTDKGLALRAHFAALAAAVLENVAGLPPKETRQLAELLIRVHASNPEPALPEGMKK